MVQPPIYDAIAHHLDWWITLHILNLVGFPDAAGLKIDLITALAMTRVLADLVRMAEKLGIPLP